MPLDETKTFAKAKILILDNEPQHPYHSPLWPPPVPATKQQDPVITNGQNTSTLDPLSVIDQDADTVFLKVQHKKNLAIMWLLECC